MPESELRKVLKLEHISQKDTWERLRLFIDEVIHAYIDISLGSLSSARQSAGLEKVIQKIAEMKPHYFSQDQEVNRAKLRKHILRRTDFLRYQKRMEAEATATARANAEVNAHHHRQGGGGMLSDRETRRRSPRSKRGVGRQTSSSSSGSSSPSLAQAGGRNSDSRSTMTIQSPHVRISGHGRPRIDQNRRSQRRSLTTAAAKEDVDTDGDTNTNTNTNTSTGTGTAPQDQHHDQIHQFLANTKPPLTHLHPYLITYGCTDIQHIEAMATWPDTKTREIVFEMKDVLPPVVGGGGEVEGEVHGHGNEQVRAGEVWGEVGVMPKPMDWHMLSYWIWRYGKDRQLE